MKKFSCILYSLLLFSSIYSQEAKEINLQLKWKHQFQFAGYYAAIEKGFYKNAGLNVNIKEGNPGMNFFEEVESGQADIGIEMPDILIERLKGRALVVLAAIFQHSPEILILRKDSKINSPHDLIRKKIMLRPDGNFTIRAVFISESVSPDDIDILNHSWSINDVIDGKVDAMSAYIIDAPHNMNLLGIEPKIIEPIKYGIDFYGDCIFTSEKYIEENEDKVKRFLSASFMGWQYAMENKEEIADLIIRKYDSKKTREALLFEAEKMETLILPKFIPIGHMNPGRWEHILDTYKMLNVVDSETEIDLIEFIYSPDPPLDFKKYYWVIIVFFSIIFIAIVITVTLLFFNVKLKKEVRRRTISLELAKKEAEKSEKVKTEFLAQMSHEIRSPINIILSFSSLLKEHFSGTPDDEIKMCFKSIDLAGERIIRTIDLLLNMSEIQTDSYEAILKKIDLHEQILVPVFNEFKKIAQAKNLKIVLNSGKRKFYVNADEYSVRQIVSNVVDNAIKYTNEGEINISCQFSGANKILLTITDSGVGISKEYLDNLFTPFSQEEQGYTRKFDGNGLGLALVKKYCDINSAQITVESEKGKGSIFKILFDKFS